MTLAEDHSDDDVVAWIDDVTQRAMVLYPGSPRTFAYGPDAEQVVDLWGSEDSPTLVVSVHGGYFAAMYGRSINEGIVRALAANGAEVANIEYRRAGSIALPSDSIDDIRDAIDAVLTRRTEPPRRVIVVGHSAGGYLALTVADHPEVDLVMALAPVTDPQRCHEEGLDDGAIADWVGASPHDEPLRWQSLRLTPPHDRAHIIVLHGEDDTIVPLEHSRQWVALSFDSDNAPALEVLRNTGHFEFLDPTSIAVARVIDEVTAN